MLARTIRTAAALAFALGLVRRIRHGPQRRCCRRRKSLLPGVISAGANDGSPTFGPDGNTLFFARSSASWSVILESEKTGERLV